MKYLNKFEGLGCWKQTIFRVLNNNQIQAKVSWDLTQTTADTSLFLAKLTVGIYTEMVTCEFLSDCFVQSVWEERWQTEIEQALNRIGRQILRDYNNDKFRRQKS